MVGPAALYGDGARLTAAVMAIGYPLLKVGRRSGRNLSETPARRTESTAMMLILVWLFPLCYEVLFQFLRPIGERRTYRLIRWGLHEGEAAGIDGFLWRSRPWGLHGGRGRRDG